MTIKLQFDPKRTVKLRKNEILNEFRVQFSQKFYEIFKNAEQNIWLENDTGFEFLDEMFENILGELDSVKANLDQKAKIWSQVASVEMKQSSSVKPVKVTAYPSQQSEPVTARATNKEAEFSVNEARSNNFGENVIAQAKPSTNKPIAAFDEDEFDFFDEA